MTRAIIQADQIQIMAFAANKVALGGQLGISGMPVRVPKRSAPLPLNMHTTGYAGVRAMTGKKGDQRSCAAFWVKGVAEALKAEGLDVAALFDEAGLDMAALSDPDSRFPTDARWRSNCGFRRLPTSSHTRMLSNAVCASIFFHACKALVRDFTSALIRLMQARWICS
jgi:hypothetical protein